jgi:hypothetical protein
MVEKKRDINENIPAKATRRTSENKSRSTPGGATRKVSLLLRTGKKNENPIQERILLLLADRSVGFNVDHGAVERRDQQSQQQHRERR